MITNDFLNNVAKAIAGESFNTIEYFSVGETAMTIAPSTTVLTDEVGTRIVASPSRTTNVIEFTGTRSGTDVVDTVDGDIIATFGTNLASGGSDLQSGVSVAGVTHTTAFDIDFIVTVTVNRS